MTRKDYEIIASVFVKWGREVSYMEEGKTKSILNSVNTILVSDMADALAANNNNFDPDRFLRACKD